ncbi:MAG: non-ribosomal peptide synthetase, partial [bacterium]|nr:non-ribosomal peptide synthetase [bacterium]
NTGINDILLTGLAAALYRWTGKTGHSVNLEGHGREPVVPGVTVARTVGWFTTSYPVVVRLTEPGDIAANIREVKENLRAVPNKGIGYGILRYLTPQEKKEDLTFTHKPQISFNYLGQFDQFDGDRQEDGAIRISHLGTGETVSPELEAPYALDINGMAAAGNLRLNIVYSAHQYQREEIETLARFYKEVLQGIILHCKNQKLRRPTPSDLTYSKLTIRELDELEQQYAGKKKTIADIYPLSPMQENMLFHALSAMEKETPKESGAAYFEQMSMEISGQIEKTLLEQTFNKLVEKYDVLRTVFLYQTTERPLQVLLEQQPGGIRYRDVTGQGAAEAQEAVETFKKEDRERGFQLTEGPLIRIALFRTGETTHSIIWSFHHILMDGWCLGIVFKEFAEIYHSLKQGKPPVEEPVVPYVRYIRWLEKQDRQKGLNYWAEYLQDYENQAVIPKQAKAAPGVYRLEKARLQLDRETTRRLNALAAEKQVTLNTIFQVNWGILLQKYNNTNDVVFGAVVSGRPPEIEGVAGIVGLFINTVPVRIKQEKQEEEQKKQKDQEGKEKGQTFTT